MFTTRALVRCGWSVALLQAVLLLVQYNMARYRGILGPPR